jgi:hypothetical protein
MIRLTQIRCDEATAQLTDEGFLEILGAVVARAGVLEYRTGAGAVVRELRDPEVIHSKAALESYEGRPVLLGSHPTDSAGRVALATQKNIDDLEVIGSMRNVRADYADDDEGRRHKVTKADVLIWSADAISAARYGTRQFSLGYRTTVERRPGVYRGEQYDARQTVDEGNHLVLTPNARAGAITEFRLDDADAVVIDHKGDTMEPYTIDGEQGEISENLKPLLDSKLEAHDEHEAIIAALTAERDALIEQVAELTSADADDDDDGDDDADEMKGDSVERQVAELVGILDQTRALVGAGYQWQGKTARQIRCDALSSFDATIDTSSLTDDAVAGAFVVAVAQHNASSANNQAIADATRGDNTSQGTSARDRARRWYTDRQFRAKGDK